MLTENDIRNMPYNDVIELCEQYKHKWCKDVNRRYCIILQVGRCPEFFSKKEYGLNHHYDGDDFIGE